MEGEWGGWGISYAEGGGGGTQSFGVKFLCGSLKV